MKTKIDILQVRGQIDQIDDEIARLFEKRMDLMEDVIAYKKEKGLPILDEKREREVLNKAGERINNPAYTKLYAALQEFIMALGRKRQQILEKEYE